IINVIAFARALQLTSKYSKEIFGQAGTEKLSAAEILYNDELSDIAGSELLEKFRQTLITFPDKVPTAGGEKPFINLDNGASTPTFLPVWEAFSKTLLCDGKVQQEVISEVKTICSRFIGAPLADYEMVFVSNATEAINLVAKNISRQLSQSEDFVVLNTYLEHNSNDLPWRMADGISVLRFPVDDDGFLDLKKLETVLCDYNEKGTFGKKRIRLLAVSGASNVLGTFNDLAEISRIAHHYGARLLVDAAQLVARRRVDMHNTGIDYLAFSAHKAYAPFGSGLLAARKELLNFTPAELENYKASGEENAAGIAALGKSLSFLQRIGIDLIEQEERTLTIQALKGLSAIPGVKVFGMKGPESPAFDRKGGVIVLSVKGIMPNVLARRLAEQGAIGVRYGCHCSHLLVKRLLRVSPGLEKFQGIIARMFSRVNFPGVTRISIGIENSSSDIETFVNTLKTIVSNPRSTVKGVKSHIDRFVSGRAAEVFE
ncbi:MAG TPA: aminotransferase class V-fold PLP-dependent enzyme, partial [Bacteroidales bacterium]|nr:aminotransferase class V-fold PLP-dependent enzyme [Bacteroidales bacterium]